jgi:DNA-binding LacI/PurR family transcriptional regulator
MSGPSAATRERVLEAADRLGYRPDRAASALASRRNRTLGVLMDVSNPFHAELILDLYDAAENCGYKLVLSTINRRNDEHSAIEALVDSRCEALILLGPESSGKFLDRLGHQLPVVVIGRTVASGVVDVVRTADDEGVLRAVEYLVDLGHTRIAYANGPRGTVSTLRKKGYEDAMRGAGLGAEICALKGGQNEADGSRVAAQTLARSGDRPTALITFNDRCAIGLTYELAHRGLDVPDGISIVGFDDSPVARLPQIDLTRVAQDARALADNAMHGLVDRLDQDRRGRGEVIVTPHLIVRGTTGPPPRV